MRYNKHTAKYNPIPTKQKHSQLQVGLDTKYVDWKKPITFKKPLKRAHSGDMPP